MSFKELEKTYLEASKIGAGPDYIVTDLDTIRTVCEKLRKNFEEVKKQPNVRITGNLVEIFKKI